MNTIRVPFDGGRNMMLKAENYVFAQVDDETGELFIHGEDYDIYLPNGSWTCYKDQATMDRMVGRPLRDAFAEPEWLDVFSFHETMVVLGKSFDDGVPYYKLRDSQMRYFPILASEFETLWINEGRKEIVTGNWGFLQIGDRYSLRYIKRDAN